MNIKVLGASGSEVAGHYCPAFLVNETILLDAGTVGFSLNIREEDRIRHILLTHAHFDHIKAIPFLLDNLMIRESRNAVTIVSGKEVLQDLHGNIFNGRIWPDFTRIPHPEYALLRYREILPSHEVQIDGYRVLMEKVNHTVPSFGFIVEDPEGKAAAYTGDTGPTDLFWKRMAGYDVKCLITEVSFPDRLEELALVSGHLTPSLLTREISKIARPPRRIFLMHAKPQYLPEIDREIRTLGLDGIRFLQAGEILEF